MKRFERFLEGLLWQSRLETIVAVVASLIVALVMLYVASADVVAVVREALHYAPGGDASAHARATIVAHVAEIVDAYLFAAVLLIFALGIYELFISKIDAIENSPIAARLLLIASLDDLKERLAKVVLVILIVRYFEYAIDAPIRTPLDLLGIAAGIALIAIALRLTAHRAAPDDAESPGSRER